MHLGQFNGLSNMSTESVQTINKKFHFKKGDPFYTFKLNY